MLLPINKTDQMEVLQGIASLDPDACEKIADTMPDISQSLMLLRSMIEDTRRILKEIENGTLKGTFADGDIETACQDIAQIMESLWGKLQGRLDEILSAMRN